MNADPLHDRPFAIKNIDHVVLCVADLARAIAFYRDVLGCQVERRVESIHLVQMRAGASLIDLILTKDAGKQDVAEPGAKNMDHFAIRIAPFETAAITAHLERHGVAVGEVAARFGAEGNGPSLYIDDPDGNSVELKGPPRES